MAANKYKNIFAHQNQERRLIKQDADVPVAPVQEGEGAIKLKHDYIPLDSIDMEDIDIHTIDPQLIESIKDFGVIDPILVRTKYEENDQFGAIYRKSIGRYGILKGNKRVAVMKHLMQTTGNYRYSRISAMIFPVEAKEQDMEEILQELNKNEGSSLSVLETIEKTRGEMIEFCHQYETIEIEPEKLRFEYNTYGYTQDELRMLALSILRFGMFDLPIILPYYAESGELLFRIIAGHKRIASVLMLKEKARNKELANSDEILQKLSKIEVRIMPLGSTKEQIDAAYNHTNLLRRHMTTDTALEHIDIIEDLPKPPHTNEEYEEFIANHTIKDLSIKVQSYFKALGFNDWKDRKTSNYLTMYYYGSNRAKEEFKKEDSPLSQKELLWIVTQNKEFQQKFQQDLWIEQALEDPGFLAGKMKKQEVRRSTMSGKQFIRNLQQKDKDLKRLEEKQILQMNEEERELALDVIRSMKKEIAKLEKMYRK